MCVMTKRLILCGFFSAFMTLYASALDLEGFTQDQQNLFQKHPTLLSGLTQAHLSPLRTILGVNAGLDCVRPLTNTVRKDGITPQELCVIACEPMTSKAHLGAIGYFRRVGQEKFPVFVKLLADYVQPKKGTYYPARDVFAARAAGLTLDFLETLKACDFHMQHRALVCEKGDVLTPAHLAPLRRLLEDYPQDIRRRPSARDLIQDAGALAPMELTTIADFGFEAHLGALSCEWAPELQGARLPFLPRLLAGCGEAQARDRLSQIASASPEELTLLCSFEEIPEDRRMALLSKLYALPCEALVLAPLFLSAPPEKSYVVEDREAKHLKKFVRLVKDPEGISRMEALSREGRGLCPYYIHLNACGLFTTDLRAEFQVLTKDMDPPGRACVANALYRARLGGVATQDVARLVPPPHFARVMGSVLDKRVGVQELAWYGAHAFPPHLLPYFIDFIRDFDPQDFEALGALMDGAFPHEICAALDETYLVRLMAWHMGRLLSRKLPPGSLARARDKQVSLDAFLGNTL